MKPNEPPAMCPNCGKRARSMIQAFQVDAATGNTVVWHCLRCAALIEWREGIYPGANHSMRSGWISIGSSPVVLPCGLDSLRRSIGQASEEVEQAPEPEPEWKIAPREPETGIMPGEDVRYCRGCKRMVGISQFAELGRSFTDTSTLAYGTRFAAHCRKCEAAYRQMRSRSGKLGGQL